MIRWSITFFILAIIFGLLGFVSETQLYEAWRALFFIFVILFIISVIAAVLMKPER